MAVETRTRIIPLNEIVIPEERQRQIAADDDLQELSDSIMSYGLLHPIIISQKNEKPHLVAGWRRFHAWKKLSDMGMSPYSKGIPSRYITDLSPMELFAVELEENIQRKQLEWQDESVSYAKYYDLQNAIHHEEMKADDDYDPEEDVSYAFVAGRLGVSERHCRRLAVVGRKVIAEDPEVLACDSSRAAGALLDRRMKRAADIELTTFGEVEAAPPLPKVGEGGDLDITLDELQDPYGTPKGVPVVAEPLDDYQVIQADFNTWVEDAKDEPKFNFVHCDFPYGKGLHESDLMNVEARDGKLAEDTDEVYWQLCESLSIASREGILSKSCHFVFWFPMDKYSSTTRFFTERGFRVDPYPLVWIKSDKMGIIPDPNRGPRRIYETALLMSTGDRKIIRPTVNGTWSDSERRGDAHHVSTKPVMVLSEFFRMFVDSDSIVLDPTCGSGTAIKAALQKHCAYALGMDIDEESVKIASEMAEAAHNLRLRGA